MGIETNSIVLKIGKLVSVRDKIESNMINVLNT